MNKELIQNEIAANCEWICDNSSHVVFVNGRLWKDPNMTFARWRGIGWPDGRIHSFKLPKTSCAGEVIVVDFEFMKLQTCKINPLKDGDEDKITHVGCTVVDGPEIDTLQCAYGSTPSIQDTIKENHKRLLKSYEVGQSGQFLFVNGDLYQNLYDAPEDIPIVFDTHKGVGWENGRTRQIILQGEAIDYSFNTSVYLADVRFGQIRKCVLAKHDPYLYLKEQTGKNWVPLDGYHETKTR